MEANTSIASHLRTGVAHTQSSSYPGGNGHTAVTQESLESYLERIIAFARRDSRFDLCLDYYICGRTRYPADPTPAQWAVVERIRTVFARRPDLQPAFCKKLTGG
jgi:hypothetical protein